MRQNRLFSLALILMVFSNLLAACGPGVTAPTVTPVSGPTDTGATAFATSVPGSETNASTGSAKAGVLRFNAGSEPDNMDPQQMSYLDEFGTAQMVYEGLLELNEKSEAVPAAAEKMDVSADGLKYTLTLREGMTYSDGVPLTAKHYEYSWKRVLDPRVPNKQYSFIAYDIAGAEELDSAPITDTAQIEELMSKVGIKAPDDKHIEFTLKRRASYFPYVLTMMVGWPARQDLIEAGGEDWTDDRGANTTSATGHLSSRKRPRTA